MEHYVTLFDSMYLPQGISLHRSMERNIKNFTLWILCLDKKTLEILQKLDLLNVKLLDINYFETDELLSVKGSRTKGEYCWTLTPFAPKFIFDTDDSVKRVTYIDADLWFRNNPKDIFLEFEESKKEVLITEHDYSKEYDQSLASGKYCVQFMTFNRVGGESVRDWWQQKCIEWCFARFEDGKFGDQKYLDDWDVRFKEKVHVLSNKELILAPWNATKYPYINSAVWHFQGLRIFKKNFLFYAYFGFYKFPYETKKYLYMKYLKDLEFSINTLNKLNFNIPDQGKLTKWQKIKEYSFSFLKKLGFGSASNLIKLEISEK